ncbi:MAG: hypothetical protein QW279_09765 [Candidatus Jordarchaeaceae archaeon]
MKRFFVLFALILLFSVAFSFGLSAFGGTELGGRSRAFVGVRVGSVESGISFAPEICYPLSSFSDINSIDTSNIQFLELDPYIFLGIPLGNFLLYAGVAPIVILDTTNFGIALYSTEMFHAKVGAKIGGGFFLYFEGLTTLTTSFATLGVFAVLLGAGISF